MILAEYANDAASGSIAMLVVVVGLGWVFLNMAEGAKNPHKYKPVSYQDNFELGYIDNPKTTATMVIEPEDELKKLKRQVEMAKLRKQLAELEEPSVDNSFLNDCVDTLVGLGTPRNQATKKAKEILQNANVKTVQEFITEYGKCA